MQENICDCLARAKYCLIIYVNYLNSSIVVDSDALFCKQGKPEAESSRSCRCECPALIWLFRASNSLYVTEHHVNHNHSMSHHGPRENNVNLGKVYNIIGSGFSSVEKVLFTKRALMNIWCKISRERANDDVRKTLEVFADIVAGDPDFTYSCR